ncbi:hypothetical protein ABT329_28775 [Streptomyces minutiscleroticus]
MPACRLGLGLASVGRPGRITLGREADLPADRSAAALRERAHQLLDAACAQGVRHVGAARSHGRAEEFPADWLRARPDARDVVVGSKWGYTYTAGRRTEAEAHDAGLTVVVEEGVANGRLTGTHAPDRLRAVAEGTGADPDAVALAFVLRRPWAGVVLSGAATTGQPASHLRAAAVGLGADGAERLARLADDPRTYRERRGRLPWR